MKVFESSQFKNPLLLSILSGILLFAAWPMSPFTFLIFIAFIPLLQLSNLNIGKWNYLGCLYLAMFIWNVSTTWWIWNASEPGAIAAFLANSLLMCIPWLLYRMIKKRLNTFLSYAALISFWMMWEYTHLQDWGLSWPWLTIGNVFATHPNWIQWYEYTGVSGGTLLVLLLNIFFYENYQKLLINFTRFKSFPYKQKRHIIVQWISILLVIGYLFLFGILFRSNLFDDIGLHGPDAPLPKNVVITQPNIDPYNGKLQGSFQSQVDILIKTSEEKIDSNTVLLVWPETALYSRARFDEGNLSSDKQLEPLFAFLQKYPKLQLFTGIESYKVYDKPTPHTRKFTDVEMYYESYNSSVLIDKDGPKQFYHKSMLVPGVETLPSFLNFLGKWFEDFGGTTNGYVKQKERIPVNAQNNIRIAPAICYESIYGEFVSKYVNNGANIISIITNDGWWKNTPGHKQHNSYARIRAIENRTPVLRSANTGISSCIDVKGKIIELLPYGQQGAIKLELPELNSKKTFYTQYPDLLFKVAVVMSVLLFLVYSLTFFIKRSSSFKI